MSLCLIWWQHAGRFYEELPNTADYVSYRLACNKEDYPEPYSPPINPPLSFLPQQPYRSQTTTATSSSSTATSKNTFSPPAHTTAIFKYPSVQGLSSPPPGVAAYTFPKEQYVWIYKLKPLHWAQSKRLHWGGRFTWTVTLRYMHCCGQLWKSNNKCSFCFSSVQFAVKDYLTVIGWVMFYLKNNSNWKDRIISWCLIVDDLSFYPFDFVKKKEKRKRINKLYSTSISLSCHTQSFDIPLYWG